MRWSRELSMVDGTWLTQVLEKRRNIRAYVEESKGTEFEAFTNEWAKRQIREMPAMYYAGIPLGMFLEAYTWRRTDIDGLALPGRKISVSDAVALIACDHSF